LRGCTWLRRYSPERPKRRWRVVRGRGVLLQDCERLRVQLPGREERVSSSRGRVPRVAHGKETDVSTNELAGRFGISAATVNGYLAPRRADSAELRKKREARALARGTPPGQDDRVREGPGAARRLAVSAQHQYQSGVRLLRLFRYRVRSPDITDASHPHLPGRNGNPGLLLRRQGEPVHRPEQSTRRVG